MGWTVCGNETDIVWHVGHIYKQRKKQTNKQTKRQWHTSACIFRGGRRLVWFGFAGVFTLYTHKNMLCRPTLFISFCLVHSIGHATRNVSPYFFIVGLAWNNLPRLVYARMHSIALSVKRNGLKGCFVYPWDCWRQFRIDRARREWGRGEM